MKILSFFLLIAVALLLNSCNKTGPCPLGYTGDDCRIKLRPTHLQVSKVEISQYPVTKGNGGLWDPGIPGLTDTAYAKADARVGFYHEPTYQSGICYSSSDREYVLSTTIFNDVTGQVLTYELTGAKLPLEYFRWKIKLWDDDGASGFGVGGPGDLMGEIEFNPKSFYADVDFPETISLEGDTFMATLQVEWIFEN